jgi:SAM-dependent methyltransferase
LNLIVELLRLLNAVPVPLVDTQTQMARARALLEANRLQIFSVLENAPGGLTADDVATRTLISVEGADVLLAALYAAGYLRRRGGRYRNGPWVRRWILDPVHGMPNYLLLQMQVWSRLETLGDVVAAGRPTDFLHDELVSEPSEGQEVYTLAMRELARLLLPEFLRNLRLPHPPRRLLDIGGAHGEYSRALVQRYNGLQATVLDLAGPIATAQRMAAEESNAAGIEFRVGDALHDDLGSGWDVVLLANVVHLFRREQNLDLFRRIREALAPGGVLVIMDQFTGMGALRDLLPALISVNLFTVGGRCYPLSDVRQLLQSAEFQRLRVKPFVPWRPSCLIHALTEAHQ